LPSHLGDSGINIINNNYKIEKMTPEPSMIYQFVRGSPNIISPVLLFNSKAATLAHKIPKVTAI
jgi:hypothetical protein